MTIPQVKSTALSVLAILIGAPLLTCLQLYWSHELHGWSDVPDALNHSSFSAFWLAIGWLFFKSPFASKFTELLQTKTYPSGATEQTSVKITEPAAEKQLSVDQKPPVTGN